MTQGTYCGRVLTHNLVWKNQGQWYQLGFFDSNTTAFPGTALLCFLLAINPTAVWLWVNGFGTPFHLLWFVLQAQISIHNHTWMGQYGSIPLIFPCKSGMHMTTTSYVFNQGIDPVVIHSHGMGTWCTGAKSFTPANHQVLEEQKSRSAKKGVRPSGWCSKLLYAVWATPHLDVSDVFRIQIDQPFGFGWFWDVLGNCDRSKRWLWGVPHIPHLQSGQQAGQWDCSRDFKLKTPSIVHSGCISCKISVRWVLFGS